jgi:hypothetical protein
MLESNTVDVETSQLPPFDDECEPQAKEEGDEVEEVE